MSSLYVVGEKHPNTIYGVKKQFACLFGVLVYIYN